MGHTYKDSCKRFDERGKSRNFRFFNKNQFQTKNRFKCGQTGKRGFSSMVDAQNRVNEILSGEVRDNITKFRIYQCEFCKNYHLTKQFNSI